LREFRIKEGDADVQEGDQIKVDVFAKGERVDVIGTSKGRGFAGTIKRHGFSRQPKTHGQSDRERAPGSVGQRSFPGRTLKGQRMSGHMGNERVTTQNLEVVLVDTERNLLAIRGSVPGHKNGIVMIKPSVKARGK
jgi:large subunit ribosomal protein L3